MMKRVINKENGFMLFNMKLFSFFCILFSVNVSSQIFYQKETVIFIADNTTVADVIIIHNEKQEESVLPQISISEQTTVVGLEQNSNAKIVSSNRYKKNKKSFEKNKASTNLKETPLVTKNNTYSKNVTFKKDSSHSFFNSERPFQTVSPSSNQEYKIVFAIFSDTKKDNPFYYIKDKEFSFFTQAKLIATLGVKSIRPPPSFL